MLRSFNELENLKVLLVNGQACGRIKDIYFDDHSWVVRFLKVSLDRSRPSPKQVLILPSQVCDLDQNSCKLSLDLAGLLAAPLDSSFLPVCQQYAVFGFGSPRTLTVRRKLIDADPHLRSIKAVQAYSLQFGGEAVGNIKEMLFDFSWMIQTLAVERLELGQRLSFNIQPKSIEVISWSTQRILLRELKPIHLEHSPDKILTFAAA